MPKIIYTQPDGSSTVISATAGDTVMSAALRNDISGIVGQCGGNLSCATCHVFVHANELEQHPDMGEMEDEMLECGATDRDENSRLSCQLVIGQLHDVHVTIPAAQL